MANASVNQADHHQAIAQGSPALIPMLWGLRVVVGRLVWGKMGV